jgi:hypothetical protein
MMIKHFVAIAAVAGLLGSINLRPAEGGPNADKPVVGQDAVSNSAAAERPGLQQGQSPSPSAAKPEPSQKLAAMLPPDPLGQDFAQIQADFQKIQKDCDGGNYEQAEKDLDRLIEHRQKYFADQARSKAESEVRAAPSGPAKK